MQAQLEELKVRPSTQAQERNRSLTPRFETMEEKRARLEKEKDCAELQGDIAVSFRLSAPNPGYIYYTEVPEGYHYCPKPESIGTSDHTRLWDSMEQQASKHISFSNTEDRGGSSGPTTKRISDPPRVQRSQSPRSEGERFDGNIGATLP